MDELRLLEVTVPLNIFTEGRIDYLCQVLNGVPIWFDYDDKVIFRVAVGVEDIEKIENHFRRLRNKISYSFSKAKSPYNRILG